MADVQMKREQDATALEEAGWTRVAQNAQTGEIALEWREAHPAGIVVHSFRLAPGHTMIGTQIAQGSDDRWAWTDLAAEPIASALFLIGVAGLVFPDPTGGGETRIGLIPELQEMVDGEEWAKRERDAAEKEREAAETPSEG